jgi:hypothetical protein
MWSVLLRFVKWLGSVVSIYGVPVGDVQLPFTSPESTPTRLSVTLKVPIVT